MRLVIISPLVLTMVCGSRPGYDNFVIQLAGDGASQDCERTIETVKTTMELASSYLYQYLGVSILHRVTIVVPDGDMCGPGVTKSHVRQVSTRLLYEEYSPLYSDTRYDLDWNIRGA